MLGGASIRVWLALGAVAAIFLFGYRLGGTACQRKHDAAFLAQIEAGQKLDRARIEAMRARDLLAQQLEELSHADPVVVERCLGPGRLRRLNTLR